MDSGAANARRCQDRPGTYEAWYVTVSDPAARRGFWLRYTTLNPAPGIAAEAHSALWAFAFDRDHPEVNWGGKVTFPLRALQTSARPFQLRLDGASLGRDGCSGEVHTERGTARWDLTWESREPPFPFLRPRWQPLSSVANVGAQPALRVSGTVEVGGHVHRLDGAPSRVRSRLGRILVGTAVGAQAKEHRFLFNGPVQVLRNRGPISPQEWRASARLGDRALSVVIKPRLEDLIGVTYSDPRGGSRFCYHTEVADLELRMMRGSETLAHVVRPASAAFEYAAETPLAGIPLTV